MRHVTPGTALPLAGGLMAGAFLVPAPALAADAVDLLPENSVIVLTARNVRGTMDRVQATPLWQELMTAEMQGEMQQHLGAMREQMAGMLDEPDLELESLLPTGRMAMSLFPVLNDETGMPMPAAFLALEYGDGAQAMMDRLERLFREGAAMGQADLRMEDIGGRSVIVISDPAAGADEPNGGDWEDDEFGGGMGGGMMDLESAIGDAFTSFMIAQADGKLLVSSHEETLVRAFELADDEIAGGLAERLDFQRMHERTGDLDLSMAVMMRDLGTMVAGADAMGMMMMVGPMIQQIIGDIDGFAMGVGLAGERSMLTQRAMIYMPNGRTGLTAMFDDARRPMEVPSFVPADAHSYSTMNIEWDQLPVVIEKVAPMLGMFLGPMGGDPQAVAQVQETVRMFTDSLGPRMHMFQSARLPVTASSVSQVMALECPGQESMDEMLSMMGAGMGLEADGFAGGRIFRMDPNMMGMMMPMPMPGGGMGGDAAAAPPAMGLGGSHLFMGGSDAVEQMLQGVADAGRPSLAADARVARVLAMLDGRKVVGWGWTDTPRQIAVQMGTMRLQAEQMQAMMEQMDPEMMGGMDMGPMGGMAMLPMMLESLPVDLTDPDALRRFIGDSAWAVSVDADGFIMDSWVMGPVEAEAVEY